MTNDIDDLLNTAASLSKEEREPFLQSLPVQTREEIRLILKADSLVQDRKLLEPISPNPINRELDVPGELRSLRDYRLRRRIGAGGMGDVFLATHTRLRRQAAVKILPYDRFQNPEMVARFDQEMEAIGQLNHPNIVQALDAGSENDHHFLVLEFVDGMDAKQLVGNAGPLPIAESCEIIRQTALGLDHAHQKQLVHRDIKPSNLLISREGVVKIADLGLASLPLNGQLTTSGAFMGTPDFVAPEQIESSKSVDARADLYALGCTFYYLLAGIPPFASEEFPTLLNKMNAQCKLAPSPISDRRKIDPRVERILMQLLEKAPENRIQSAKKVSELLKPFAERADLSQIVVANKQEPELESAITDTILGERPSTTPVAHPHVKSLSAKSSEKVTQSQPKNFRIKSGIMALVAIGILGWGLSGNWQQIMRIVTGRGVLVLENAGEGIEVTVTQGDRNKPVQIFDKEKNRTYELSIGSGYRVKVRDPETGTDFESEEFSIKRNGRKVVDVRVLPPKPPKDIVDWGFKNGLANVSFVLKTNVRIDIPEARRSPDKLPATDEIYFIDLGLKPEKPGQAAQCIKKFGELGQINHIAHHGPIPVDEACVSAFNSSGSTLFGSHSPVTREVLNCFEDSTLARLQHFELRDTSKKSDLDDETVKVITSKCKNLRNLTIAANHLSVESIKAIGQMKLEVLAIIKPNQSFLDGMAQLKQVEELQLYLDKASTLDATKLPPNLTKLEVSPAPTSNELKVMERYPRLKWVQAWGNGKWIRWKRSGSADSLIEE